MLKELKKKSLTKEMKKKKTLSTEIKIKIQARNNLIHT